MARSVPADIEPLTPGGARRVDVGTHDITTLHGPNTHERYSLCQRALFLSRRLDRFVRVLDQALGSAYRARDVKTTVEIPEILRGLERLLERGLREAQGGAEPLELALIDLPRRHWSQMLTSVR